MKPIVSRPSIIFHHPLPLAETPTSGSQVRPMRMVEAFRGQGCHVEVVAGFANERRQAIRRVRAMLEAGHAFSFAYAEASTMPTLLTESHHLPTHPLLDFSFFRMLRQHAVPVGLFYRDAYWRFPVYDEQVSAPKRWVAKTFYWYDWLGYRATLDCLFLPSVRMLEVLPAWSGAPVVALPPGCPEEPLRRTPHAKTLARTAGRPLRLFYVGGVQPPLYDLRPALEAVRGLEGVCLTLCCRAEEWAQWQSFYGGLAAARNVHVVHAHGATVAEYFRSADVFLDVRKEHPYLRYTLPIKTFETLGYGVPAITSANSEAARFTEREGTGWVVSGASEAQALIARLSRQREEIMEKRSAVITARRRHTWSARAQDVIRRLA